MFYRQYAKAKSNGKVDHLLTFQRVHLAKNSLPEFEKSRKKLRKVHFSSHGTMEHDGRNMLQVNLFNIN